MPYTWGKLLDLVFLTQSCKKTVLKREAQQGTACVDPHRGITLGSCWRTSTQEVWLLLESRVWQSPRAQLGTRPLCLGPLSVCISGMRPLRGRSTAPGSMSPQEGREPPSRSSYRQQGECFTKIDTLPCVSILPFPLSEFSGVWEVSPVEAGCSFLWT